jgi:hypothetical protein
MTKIIPLTQGKEAIVDDDDYEWLNQWKWCFVKTGYAIRGKRRPERGIILMHREIMHTPNGMYTDHINGDKLCNLRCNLRICTASQNIANTNKLQNNTSGYKGVYFEKERNKWVAGIHDKKNRHIKLGRFKNKIDAAKAYDKAAREMFGEFAKTNF